MDYSFRLGGARRLVLLADAFNLFNQRTVLGYDEWIDSTFGAANPDYGQPSTSVLGGNPSQIQTAFQLRIGARLQF